MSKVTAEERELFLKLDFTEEEQVIYHEIRKEHPNLTLTPERIMWCVISKKTKEKAVKLLKNFDELSKDVDTDRMCPEHLKFLGEGHFVLSDKINLEDGTVVMCMFMSSVKNFTPDRFKPRFVVEGLFALFMRAMERHPSAIRSGVVFIVDFSGFSLAEIPWDLRRMIMPIFQNIPFRIKKICVYKPPWWFKVAIAIARPFTPKKYFERFTPVSTDEEFHKLIPKEKLPTRFNGNVKLDQIANLIDCFCRSEEEVLICKKLMDEKKPSIEEV